MNNNDVNSHIQMPKCVLKRFENENRSFYYYDVEKNIIGSNGHAKSINTQFGYFSEEVEHYLRDNIETPFSAVLQFVDNTDFDTPEFCVSNNFNDNVKAFVYALLARNPMLLSEINKNSVFNQFLPKQSQHDFATLEGIRLAQEQGFFDSYFVTFSVNKTKKPFVLPICGIYSYKMQDAIHVNLPVSPQIAITLVEPKGVAKLLNKNVLSMYSIEEEVIVDRFNGWAFRAQCNTSWGYLVSPKKSVLEELQVRLTSCR